MIVFFFFKIFLRFLHSNPSFHNWRICLLLPTNSWIGPPQKEWKINDSKIHFRNALLPGQWSGWPSPGGVDPASELWPRLGKLRQLPLIVRQLQQVPIMVPIFIGKTISILSIIVIIIIISSYRCKLQQVSLHNNILWKIIITKINHHHCHHHHLHHQLNHNFHHHHHRGWLSQSFLSVPLHWGSIWHKLPHHFSYFSFHIFSKGKYRKKNTIWKM